MYTIVMYLFSLLDVTGKQPFWSVAIFPVMLMHFTATRFVQNCCPALGGAFIVTVGLMVIWSLGLVLQMFLWVNLR